MFLGLTKVFFGWFGGVESGAVRPARGGGRRPARRRQPDALPPAQGLLVRRRRAHGCRSDFQRRSRVPATGVEERGDHAHLDGDDPGNPVSRRFDPRPPLAPVSERTNHGVRADGQAGVRRQLRVLGPAARDRRHPHAGGEHGLRRLPAPVVDHRPRRLLTAAAREPRRSAGVLERCAHPRHVRRRCCSSCSRGRRTN